MLNFEANLPIEEASTLEAEFYRSPSIWEQVRECVFKKRWLYLGRKNEMMTVSNNVFPFVLLDKFLSEPLMLTEKEGQIRCLSNVCTHRAFLLSHHPSNEKKLICKYHGRKFDLDGKMEFMPEFKEAENFPRPCDHLHELPLKNWKNFLFTAIDANFDFDLISKRLNERVGHLNIEAYRYAPEYDKIYNVQAHWALYCDNYLEGFHIPFVHDTLLGKMVDYGQYTTECYEYINLQIGFSSAGTPYFDLPKDHIDFGKKVTAYYYWIYPNMMLNFYPWGLQINIVVPQSPTFTKVLFHHYIADEDLWHSMNGELVAEKTQREDEWVVEGVQKGLQSSFYKSGRFSPKREQGVHHFHGLLYQDLMQQNGR